MTQKIKLILLLGIMSGCKTNQTLVQRSDVAFENIKTNEIYICKCGTGTTIYQTWMTGIYGDTTKVHLIDSVEFEVLSNKPTRIKNNLLTINK
jgi:hypothetical protein